MGRTACLFVDLKTFKSLTLPKYKKVSLDTIILVNCGLREQRIEHIIRDIVFNNQKFTILVNKDIIKDFIRLGICTSLDDWLNKIKSTTTPMIEMKGFKLLRFEQDDTCSTLNGYNFNFDFINVDGNTFSDNDIPEEFICPLSLQLMFDPVTLVDGKTYERDEITNWIIKNKTSPITREHIEFDIRTFRTDWKMRNNIFDFLDKNPQYYKYQYIRKKDFQLNFDYLITLIENNDFQRFQNYLSTRTHLLESEVESNFFDDRYKRLIFFALKNFQFFEYLCSLGVDLNVHLCYSKTYPIHLLFNYEYMLSFDQYNDHYILCDQSIKMEYINIFHSYGFDLNKPNNNGNTLLMLSLMNIFRDLFYHLIHLGADISCINNNLYNVLSFSIKYNLNDITDFLMNHENRDSLVEYEYNNYDMLSFILLFHDNDFNKFRRIYEFVEINLIERSITLLCNMAFKSNNIAVVRYLTIQKHATLEEDSGNILYDIKSHTNINLVRFVVNRGIDVNKQSVHGLRPLHFALSSSNIVVIEYLLNRGAVLNHSNEFKAINQGILIPFIQDTTIPIAKRKSILARINNH